MRARSRARDSSGTAVVSHRSSREPAAATSTVSRGIPASVGGFGRGPGQEESDREQRDADGDGGVGEVEGGPVIAPIVDVDEVDDGAQAGAVDEVAHGAAE